MDDFRPCPPKVINDLEEVKENVVRLDHAVLGVPTDGTRVGGLVAHTKKIEDLLTNHTTATQERIDKQDGRMDSQGVRIDHILRAAIVVIGSGLVAAILKIAFS